MLRANGPGPDAVGPGCGPIMATSDLAYRSGPRTKTSVAAVRVARHEVGGLGLEGDEAAVGGDRRVVGASRSPASRRSTRSRVSSCPASGRARRRRPCRSCRPPRGWRPRTRRRRSGRRRRSTGEAELPFACFPALDTLTRLVVPRFRSRTKMSAAPFVSPATRLEASDRKATKRPSAEIDGPPEPPFACFPALDTLTRLVVPGFRSRTKTSARAVRVARHEVGGVGLEGDEAAVGGDRRARRTSRSPAPRRWTRSRARSCPLRRSRTKTSPAPFVSPATRLEA